MLEEFKKFIMRGNVLDMAIGIVIGAAFGTIINSFVKDVIMPHLLAFFWEELISVIYLFC